MEGRNAGYFNRPRTQVQVNRKYGRQFTGYSVDVALVGINSVNNPVGPIQVFSEMNVFKMKLG
jgi:hypothetical protein